MSSKSISCGGPDCKTGPGFNCVGSDCKYTFDQEALEFHENNIASAVFEQCEKEFSEGPIDAGPLKKAQMRGLLFGAAIGAVLGFGGCWLVKR